MAKGLIDLLLDQIFDAEWIGRRGEKLTERELKLVKLFGRDGKVLRNVYVPKDNGETSEIDVLFITQKGVFVIESKNFSGWVFGNEADRSWTVSLPNGQKNRFYNPIKQNRSHLKWLAKYLADDTPLFSIIVFSERCELKKVTVESSDVSVVKRDRLYATVRRIWEGAEDVLDAEGVDSLYERLRALTDVGEAAKAAHVANIQERYVAKKPVSSASACPRCGADLVLRTAKKGPNAGNQFYGCSNYPKCRYTREA
ncbi:NERD domain-containing protein [Arabiibacter massiliensis]|uniref:NERD domain-containing protein n=1 Tax=Arabiibacter massiliensis TaxID=1870985 RepID=UPI0009BC3057|nr:NERD domain-containing protein [Arabiibacter massiliensis]